MADRFVFRQLRSNSLFSSINDSTLVSFWWEQEGSFSILRLRQFVLPQAGVPALQ